MSVVTACRSDTDVSCKQRSQNKVLVISGSVAVLFETFWRVHISLHIFVKIEPKSCGEVV